MGLFGWRKKKQPTAVFSGVMSAAAQAAAKAPPAGPPVVPLVRERITTAKQYAAVYRRYGKGVPPDEFAATLLAQRILDAIPKAHRELKHIWEWDETRRKEIEVILDEYIASRKGVDPELLMDGYDAMILFCTAYLWWPRATNLPGPDDKNPDVSTFGNFFAWLTNQGFTLDFEEIPMWEKLSIRALSDDEIPYVAQAVVRVFFAAEKKEFALLE
jgi:hypothetical protein